MFRFGYIANNTPLGASLRDLAVKAGDALEVRICLPEKALGAAEELLKEGVEGLIATPATAELIERRFDVPVVAVYPSMLDLLRALGRAKDLGRRCGVGLFGGRPEGVEELGLVLGLEEVRPIPYVDDRDLRYGLAGAVEAGVDVLVGGATTQAFAQHAGRPSVMVAYGREGLEATLDLARALIRLRRGEQRKAEELRAVVELSQDGAIVVDGGGRVVLCNDAAAAMLGQPRDAVLGGDLAALAPDLGLREALQSGEPEVDRLVGVNDIRVVASCLPIRGDGGVQGAAVNLKEVARIQSIEDRVRKETANRRGFVARYTLSDLVARSRAMRGVVERARQYAQTDSTVLIRGESGTGKELLAQGIHRASPRRDQPFVAVSCLALPETLLESELFGYEEGAFTGARRGGKPGLFEMAHGGTIFLDEVAGVSPNVQARLLRVLQTREAMRVGGDRILTVDVRVIAASNQSLSALARQGQIRADLVYRLNVLRLELPPLRERPDDIPELIAQLLARFCAKYNRPRLELSPRLMEGFARYPWPGNVRQLEHLLERYVLLHGAHAMSDEEVMAELSRELILPACTTPESEAAPVDADGQYLARQLDQVERRIIFRTLEACGFDRNEAARRLGISVRTFWRKLALDDGDEAAPPRPRRH